MKIRYSPDAKEKLFRIKRDAGKAVAEKILKGIKGISDNPWKCQSVENVLGMPSPYFFLHTEHNFVFYRIENEIIYVTDVYNEREDFLRKMFGISLRTQESIDYWGE